MSYPTQAQTPAKLRIVSHGNAPSTDPTRAGQLDFFVIYSPDTMHRFTVIIPQKDPTPEQVDQAIREDYLKQQRFINREVSV